MRHIIYAATQSNKNMTEPSAPGNSWGATIIAKFQELQDKMDVRVDGSALIKMIAYPIDEKNIKYLQKTTKGGTAKVKFGKFYDVPVVVKMLDKENEAELAMEISKHYILSRAVFGANVSIPPIIGINQKFLVMQRVRGEPLSNNVHWKMSLDQFSSMVKYCQCLSILGIQHNDLHSGNIIISGDDDNSRIFVIDYGEGSGPEAVDDISNLWALFNNWVSPSTSKKIRTIFSAFEADSANLLKENSEKAAKKSLRTAVFVELLSTLNADTGVVFTTKVIADDSHRSLRHITSANNSAVHSLLLNLTAKNPKMKILSCNLVDRTFESAAWLLLDHTFTEDFLHSALNMLVEFSPSHRVLLNHCALGDNGVPVHFEQDAASNKLILHIPLPAFGNRAIYFQFSEPNPWMFLRICFEQDDGPESVLYCEYLSFVIPAEHCDVTSHIENCAGDQKALILTISIPECLHGVRIPSPLLSSFFENVEAATDALLKRRAIVNRGDLGDDITSQFSKKLNVN